MNGRTEDPRPLIAHVIYRLDVGGLENGLINLINRLPAERYRHAVICLTEYTDFARRLERDDITLHAIHKRPGKDPAHYLRLWRLLRELHPAIVHTRNLGTLDAQAIARLAGVRGRVHGEHGWDNDDPDGRNAKNQRLRRIFRPFVHRYIALSRHIAEYLQDAVRVPEDRIAQIYNGVDTSRFAPAGRRDWVTEIFGPGEYQVFGTVGRLQQVKDQITLLRAFARLRERHAGARERARLVLVGDGPLRAELEAERDRLDLKAVCWIAGQRDDVPTLLAGMDVFVLPSLAEGICNTVLEAMACGVPVIATGVGGNPELVEPEGTGLLVAPGDVDAHAEAMGRYVDDPAMAAAHGARGRERVQAAFSLSAMVDAYARVYDRVLAETGTVAVTNRRAGTIDKRSGTQGE